MKKADYFLFLFLIMLFCIFPLLITINTSHKSEAKSVIVEVDGIIVKTLPLAENTEICMDTSYGKNVIRILDKSICITDSDCKNQDCIKMGETDKPEKQLICLPHHLCVYISSEKKTVDGEAY